MDYKELFTFTQQERRGIATFLVLAFTIVLVGKFWPVKPAEEEIEDLSKYYFPEDSIVEKDEHYEEDIPFGQERNVQKRIHQKFVFDPNKISYDSLLLLGFSKFGAKSLTNFVAKGGKIKDAAKFKTIFGIDSNLVNELLPMISYPVPKVFETAKIEKEKIQYPEQIQSIVELNSADSLTLEAMKGVGPYMVKRILQYRNRLGGFLYKDQISELNIIADSLYQPVSQYFTVDPSLIQKIKLNTADYKTFTKHPYFSAETTNAILKYRKQHGPFSNIQHISRIRSLKEEVGKKILPYLTVD